MLAPGDGLVLNDPYLGNGHLPDFFCFFPIYVDGQLVGFSGSCAHHADVGGAAPGSQVTAGIFDMYQEGVRVPPVRLFRDGAPVDELLRVITANVRRPTDMVGDLKAQASACAVGARRIQELYAEYGDELVEDCVEQLLDRTEQAMRDAVSEIPDGRYEFEDRLDDYGPDTDPVVIKATVEVEGSRVKIDFAGTSLQVRAALNCPFNFTYAYSLFALKTLTDPTIPENEGGRRVLEVSAPRGCFLNPTVPAPTGARATVAIRIVDAIMGAMSQALPGRAVAAPSHFVNTTFGGFAGSDGAEAETGEGFVYYELLLGSFGARPEKDGVDGLVSCFNTGNIPIEVHEATAPVLIHSFGFTPDSAGPGKYRGGVGVQKEIELLSGPIRLTNLSDRYRFRPWGLFGGGAGAPGDAVLTREGQRTQLHSKVTCELQMGDVIAYHVSGAGGWGDPFERRPEAVLEDVLNGLVSAEAAREAYRVAIDAATGTVDRELTEALRRGAAQAPPTSN
jgi:N-methylhydantoinase B